MLQLEYNSLNNNKYVNIDGNKFVYNNEYILYIENIKKQKYTFDSNLFEYRWINYPENFEATERKLIKKYVTSNSTVLELGGNIGATSCLINNMLSDPKSHIVSEINPFFRLYLEQNKIINRCQFTIVEQIDKIKDNSNYNTIVSDIEGDEYKFFLNNISYIKKYVALIIVEFHKRYKCKNNKPINKQLIKKTEDFLYEYFTIIETDSNTRVYKKKYK